LNAAPELERGGPVIRARIRDFRRSDAPRLAPLVYACNRVDGWAFRETVEILTPDQADPSVPPEQYWLVAESGGKLVGLAGLGRETGTRLYALLWVAPDCRGGPIEVELIEGLCSKAKGLPEPYLDVAVRPTQSTYAAALESGQAFTVVRTWYVMRIELDRDLPPPFYPRGVTVRSFAGAQDEAMLTTLIHDCFWDHWGEGTHTLEDTRYGVQLPGFDPQLLLVAERDRQPLGYVWSWTNEPRTAVAGRSCAYIGDLGVRAAFRRQGLGRALLLQSLRDLKARGMGAAELDMDGPNENARRLYESVGFYPYQEVRWYRRELRDETEGKK
jgi:mycothiol synthase